MNLVADEGLILRVLPHGEADKLVTWHGAAHGRVTALAKGAQKSRKRFTNKLEPFTRLRFYYRPPRSAAGLHFLEDADLLDAHHALRRDYARFLAASLVAELTLRFTRDLDADPRIHGLLGWTLDEIDRNPRFLRFPLFFHLKLLEYAGYMPDFGRCRRCGTPFVGPAAPDLGGQTPGGAILRCAACAGGTLPREYLLSLQSVRTLAHVSQAVPDTLTRLHPPLRGIVEGLNVLHLYSQYLLQTDLRCWPLFRRTLKNAGPDPEEFRNRPHETAREP